MKDRKAEYEANKEAIKKRSSDWYYANREHAIARNNRYYHANRAKVRERELLRKYGLTQAAFDARLADQGGHCALCPAIAADARGGPLHVDHAHACCPGEASCGRCVRGLLCTACNNGLGLFRDDLLLLERAAAYLLGEK